MQTLRIKEIIESYRGLYVNIKILPNFSRKSDTISSFKRHFLSVTMRISYKVLKVMRLRVVLLAIIGGYLKLRNCSQEMTQSMKVLILVTALYNFIKTFRLTLEPSSVHKTAGFSSRGYLFKSNVPIEYPWQYHVIPLLSRLNAGC